MLLFNKKGESLIEVVLGLAILTAVTVAAYVLTNHATKITQAANEKTEVSNLMRQQIEVLNAIEASHKDGNKASGWGDVLSKVHGGNYSASCKDIPNNSGSVANPTTPSAFILNPSDSFKTETAFDPNKVTVKDFFGNNKKYTIWLEAYAGDDPKGLGEYIDVFVTACWETVGGSGIEKSAMSKRFIK